MVVLFVPKESEPGETRVAAVPETVKHLVQAGVQVIVQAGAGTAVGIPDQDFVHVGARIAEDYAQGAGSADMVLRVRPPKEGTPEVNALRPGTMLVTGLQPMLRLPLVKALAEHRVVTLAMDLVPRITRAQNLDVLSSQATAAGYMAVLLAATHLPKFFPLLMTAAGTITPARVFVLGAGVAGLQAIATARRLGATVEANDVRPAVKDQVESLGAKFVDTGINPEMEAKGGYAKEATAEYLQRQREILTKHVTAADVVITTALIPGKKAPILVTDDMVRGMRPGSVIVDLAVEMGGNVEGSVKGAVVTRHGVKLVGEPNLPALLGQDSSRMWARNVQAFLKLVLKNGHLQPDWNDEIVKAMLVTQDGQVVHAGAAQALGAAQGAS
ncbi:MAG: Re/Si-specific NAD(P)(+) transhydrogenase subunit alpha [Planctomycetes bacterium]|nr:Re/Si-specific NAD(P)(+) transhydrogenase subunit alpha [Planctomycetota bacterium]